METLKTRILRDGKILPGGILRVDSFINHQIDPTLMQAIADEFVREFSDAHIDKIVTVEASGIAPAVMTGSRMRCPVVFAKKTKPNTMENALTAKVFSFTKRRYYDICIHSEYLHKGEHILFVDDFLAHGNAAMGILELAQQAGAEIVGMGFIIEKSFQAGGTKLRQLGIRVKSLATVDENGNIE